MTEKVITVDIGEAFKALEANPKLGDALMELVAGDIGRELVEAQQQAADRANLLIEIRNEVDAYSYPESRDCPIMGPLLAQIDALTGTAPREATAQDGPWVIYKNGRGYYRADYCGYAIDPVGAGLYTRAAAEAEVTDSTHKAYPLSDFAPELRVKYLEARKQVLALAMLLDAPLTDGRGKQ